MRAFDQHVIEARERSMTVVTVMWSAGKRPVQVVSRGAPTARQRSQMTTYEAPARQPVDIAELKQLGRHDNGNLSWDGVVRGHRFQQLSSNAK